MRRPGPGIRARLLNRAVTYYYYDDDYYYYHYHYHYQYYYYYYDDDDESLDAVPETTQLHGRLNLHCVLCCNVREYA